jgi:hypothetical protein
VTNCLWSPFFIFRFLSQNNYANYRPFLKDNCPNIFCSYFGADYGWGHFIDRPSPPNGRVASKILSSAGQAQAAALAKSWTVRLAVETMTHTSG